MIINAFVKQQTLTLPRKSWVAGSRDYVGMNVIYQTADWAGLSVTAFFGNEADPMNLYTVDVVGGKIPPDKHLNLSAGKWKIWLVGLAPDGTQKISTQAEIVEITSTGCTCDDFPEVPYSYAEDFARRLSALEAGGGGGGGGGTTDHSKLINRGQPDQHPMEAITGLTELRDKINTFFNADDPTLDQLAELIQAIKANQGTIEGLTNGKVSVSDIVNDLTTGGANKVLSAEMGKELKRLIDAVPDWAMSPAKPTYNAQEVGALSQSELQSGIDKALAQAKQSGEFDGADGKPGRDGTDGKPGKDGGHYTPSASQPSPDTMRIEFTGSLPNMPPVDPTTVNLPKGEGGSDTRIPVKKMVETTATLEPDTEYIWGEVASLTLDFAPVPEDGFSHDFIWDFVSGEIPTTLNLPESIKWAGGAAPTIQSGKAYMMLVHNGGAYYAEF